MEKTYLRIAKYYWTFFASVAARNRRPDISERQILITRFDGLGDFFLLVPFLQSLVANNYKIVCISPPVFESVIMHLKLPITFIPFKNKNIKEFQSLINTVKSMNFDYAFNLNMNAWGGILVNQSRSRVKIGLLQECEYYIYKGAHLFYDKMLSYLPKMHIFEVFQNVFSSVIKPITVNPHIDTFISTGEFIVIHPYSSWAPKIWPHFLLLIQELINKGNLVRIIGTAEEHKMNAWLPQIANNLKTSIVTLSSIDHLMNEIESALAFIGNDSGTGPLLSTYW